MDCMDGRCFGAQSDEEETGAGRSEPGALQGPAETELQFLARRAMEESRLAKQAPSPQAAAAHSYLAGAYSAQISKELARQAELEDLLLQMH